MALGSPRNQLLNLVWWLTVGMGGVAAALFSALETPFDVTMLAVRLTAIGTLTFACTHWRGRDREGATVLLVTAAVLLATLDALAHAGVWQALRLGPLLQAAIGGFGLFALTLLHGWRGAIGGGLLALWPQVTASSVPVALAVIAVQAFAGAAGFGLHGMLDAMNSVRRDLEKRANSDAMTRLGNRRGLEDDFRRYRANAKRWGVPLLLIAWDVDGLKRINDSKGHAAGDMHILHFVQALRAAVRQGDGLYRIGGDEFVSLHPGLSLEDAAIMYGRVHRKFDHVSAGWVRATNDSLDEALREADAKLYEEKKQRKAGGKAAKRTILSERGSAGTRA